MYSTLFFSFFFFVSLEIVAFSEHYRLPIPPTAVLTFACGHEGSAHPSSPVLALCSINFYGHASSTLLQLVNQWLNFTYSRSHTSLCRLCVCVFLCSHWSLVDVPLIFFCPADHVPDWQPRVLLGMVEARSVNVKKTTTTTTSATEARIQILVFTRIELTTSPLQ